MQSVRAIELENNELKKILGRDVVLSTTSASVTRRGETLAAVLRRPPLLPYDELVIDVGGDDGIVAGDTVYAPGKVLIGRVESVRGSTARVILYSSPGKQYEVMIGPQHIPTTARGRGGGQYEAEVARDLSVTEGDFVEVPSLEDRPFGIVTTVMSDPTQPFKTILFAPSVNVYQLRWVIVKKHRNE
jgi:cell shape-determining protein MreC